MLKMLMSWKVNAWQLQTLFGGGRMREFPELMPGPAGVETVARFVAQTRLDRYPIYVFTADCVGFFTELDPIIRETPWQGCQAGLRSIGIEANGNVKGCLSLCPELQENNPFVEGNLHDEKLIDIWNKPGAFAYTREFDASKAEGRCARCKHLEACRCGCSAQAYFSTGGNNSNPYCILAERERRAEELREEKKSLLKKADELGETEEANLLRDRAKKLEMRAKKVLHPDRPYPTRIVRNKLKVSALQKEPAPQTKNLDQDSK